MAFSHKELELAFAYHVVQLIVGADAKITSEETVYLSAHFPADILASSGFTTANGSLTERFAMARDEALDVLPRVLGRKQKLDLVTMFLGAAVVDDDLQRNESAIVVASSQLLGIPNSEMLEHLDSLEGTVAQVELPEPEPESKADEEADAESTMFIAEDTLDLE